MRSTIAKHSFSPRGHKTSLSLEAQFWTALKEIAAQREMALSDLIAEIDAHRTHNNLSSVARLFVLGVYKKQLTEYCRPQSLRISAPQTEPFRPSPGLSGTGAPLSGGHSFAQRNGSIPRRQASNRGKMQVAGLLGLI